MKLVNINRYVALSVIFIGTASECFPYSSNKVHKCSEQKPATEIFSSMPTPGSSWSVNNNRLEVYVKSTSDLVMLCCSIQEPLTKVQNEAWYGCIEIEDIEKYALEIGIIAKDHELSIETWIGRNYRGIIANDSSQRTDRDSTFTYEFDSEFVGRRKITMYLPTQTDRKETIPVMYVADGQSVVQLAHYFEKAINGGLLPPVALVGIWPSSEKLTHEENAVDGRALEYLAGYDAKFPDHFRRHNDFLIREIIPYVEKKYNIGLSRKNRMIAGFSNGGAWAISTALENSNLFSSAISASAGWTKSTSVETKASDVKFFVNYGNLETGFKAKSIKIADSLRQSGNIVVQKEQLGGHSMQMWKDAFIASLSDIIKR